MIENTKEKTGIGARTLSNSSERKLWATKAMWTEQWEDKWFVQEKVESQRFLKKKMGGEEKQMEHNWCLESLWQQQICSFNYKGMSYLLISATTS